MPRTASTRPELRLALRFADARHRAQLPRHRVARWIRAALEHPAEVAVRVVGEVEGRTLNRDYRERDYATNVLTFVYDGWPGDDVQAGSPVRADLVLCAPVVESEANAQRIDVVAHYAHLIVHGTLHAQGYEHDDELDAARMEARESAILHALGFADPYAPARAAGPA